MAIDTSRALAPFTQMRELVANYPSERYHLLLPTTLIGMSPLFIPTPVVITVDAEDERDVYGTPGGRGDTVCFHATTLQRIANASGLDFDPSLTRHRHDRKSEPWVCEQIVAGWYIDSLGQRRLISSDWTTHDLRDGSPRANLITKQSGKALDVARQFICEQCGTRARSRAIRKALQMKSSYTKAELSKPFVAFRFRLDEADEDVKRALIARGVGATFDVFGGNDTRVPDAPATAAHDTMEDVSPTTVVDAEPTIPDDAPAAAAPADVPAITARFVAAAKRRDDGRDRVSDPDGRVAFALRDVLGLGKIDKADLGLVRRKMVTSLFGVGVADLTAAMVAVIIDASKDPQGQADLGAVFAQLVQIDDGIRAVADKAK